MDSRATIKDSQHVHPLTEKVRASKPPIAELIGFDVQEISEGRSVAILQSGPQHASPMGTLHGGVLCDLTDAAMGMAFASTLAQEESFTTIANKSVSLLQSGSTCLTAALFSVLGIPVYREGFFLTIPGITIEAARECSGINSSVVPLSVLKNAIRITTLVFLRCTLIRDSDGALPGVTRGDVSRLESPPKS